MTDIMTEDNKTIIEKDDNLTVIESSDREETETRDAEPPERFGSRPICLGGSTYNVERRLDVVAAEADLYLITGENGEKRVLKYYRPKIEPKRDVVELVKSFAGRGAVRIIETGRHSNRFYEIQEFAEHGTLADMLKASKRPSREFITEFIRKAAGCLWEIHSKKLIHRDIKPSNILIRSIEPLDIALTDFGISSLSRLSLHQTSMNRTVLYASPESMAGIISKSTDYWSLGMILLEMVIGKNPFDGTADKVVMFTLATRAVPGVGKLKSEFTLPIMGLLTRNPKKRWGHKEITAWLSGSKDIAVFFGDASDGISSARALHPYRFAGKDYFELREMSLPMAKSWEEAVKDFESGALRDWIARELGDKEMLAMIEDIVENSKDSPEEKLFEFFCRADGEYPFVFRGRLISREYLLELASKIIKNSASPEDKNFMRDVFRLGIIKKYSRLCGDSSVYELYEGIVETCSGFDSPEDHSSAVLAHFSEEYRRALAERVRDAFDNYYVLSPSDDGRREQILKPARKVAACEEHTVSELIWASKITGLDLVKKKDFDSAAAGLKSRFIELDEKNEIKNYKEMFTDEDWILVTAIARNAEIEHSRPFYEKMITFKKLLDGKIPSQQDALNAFYSRDNYVDVSEIPPEILEPPPEPPGITHGRASRPFVGTDAAQPAARFYATLYDMGFAMLTFLFSVTLTVAGSAGPVPLAFIESLHNRFFFILLLVYIPIVEYFLFATPGKMNFGIAAAGPDGNGMSLVRSFFRALSRFAMYYIYGCAAFTVYRFLFDPAFPSSYTNIGSAMFLMAFYAGGIFDYIYMYFGGDHMSSCEYVNKCAVVERKRDVNRVPAMITAAVYILVTIFTWVYLLMPYFDLNTMRLDRYAWRYLVDPGTENVKYNAGRQELIVAADRDEYDLVKLLLHSRPQFVNVTDRNGFPALFFAAQKGNEKIVKLLLDRGANPNIAGKILLPPLAEGGEGEAPITATALTAACAAGKAGIVKMLCAHGADVNFADPQGLTPLIIAVMAKNLDMVKTVVEAGATIEARDSQGFTALAMAAYVSDARIFEYLLSRGADFNTATGRGFTPLMIAAGNNGFEIARMLINMGCKIEACDEEDAANALIFSIRARNSKITEMLIDKTQFIDAGDKYRNSPLIIAAAVGDVWAVSKLISHGANVNHHNIDYNTALMVASSAADERLIKILIDAGADPKLKNREGYTALQMYNGAIEIRRATRQTTTTTATDTIKDKYTTTATTPETITTTRTETTASIKNITKTAYNNKNITRRYRWVIRPSSHYGHKSVGVEFISDEIDRNSERISVENKVVDVFRIPPEVNITTTLTKGQTQYKTEHAQNVTSKTHTTTKQNTNETITTFGDLPAPSNDGSK
ncbi:MAG TPA: hypothetical protein DC017_12555 [Candidatus Wallbacteria bacterium]|nr:hypothetical protein [Candidatus Wallbacteria bacterium]